MNHIHQEAIQYLQNLIRINTTNPPGHEMEAILYIKNILEKENLNPIILESVKGRGNLVCRLKGSGNKSPIILTSHIDVVPAEKSKWKYDPFGGEIHEDCIWGRGAVDMKQMTVMEMMTLIECQRKSLSLNRDIILVVVSDEEAGCEYGSEFLVKHHAELISDAEIALNEVGGFSLYQDDQVFYPIGVAEKGLCWLKLNFYGDPGHGSIPHYNQANVKMAQVISDINKKHLSFGVSSALKGFLFGLSSGLSGSKKHLLKLLSHSFPGRFISRNFLPKDKSGASFYALLHNTATVTQVHAGQKTNVIPSHAGLEVDGRIIPGHTVQSFLDDLKDILGKDFDFEIIKSWNPTETQIDSSVFQILSNSIKKYDPQGIPIPYLIPGFTDARWYAELGIQTYGFSPVKLKPDMNFSELFHGHNERIPVDGFCFGVDVLKDAVLEICR